MSASDVTFASDVDVMGYLAKPAKEGTYPGVIVIHENRGLTDHIKDVARRLAKAGYVALAPDLVSRAGGTAKKSRDQIAGLLSQSKPEDLVKDLSAGVDHLLKQPGVKQGQSGRGGLLLWRGLHAAAGGGQPQHWRGGVLLRRHPNPAPDERDQRRHPGPIRRQRQPRQRHHPRFGESVSRRGQDV